VGDWYGQMTPETRLGAGGLGAGIVEASVFLVAGCLSSQFALAGKRYAVTQGDMA
jgi:hypothetical protein